MWHISNGQRNCYHEILVETAQFGLNFQLVFDVNQSAGFGILAGDCCWYFNHMLVSLFSLFANAARLFLQQPMNLPFDGQSWRLAVIVDDFVQCEFQLLHVYLAVICDNRLDKMRKKQHVLLLKRLFSERIMPSIKLIGDTCQDSMM